MRIEIKGFLETSFVDWPGKICSVLFLPLCNFRCPYCHNHLLVFHPEQYPSIPFDAVLARLKTFRGWVDGVCLTGGEPTLHVGLPELVQKIKQEGFLVKLDTNGSDPERLAEVLGTGAVDFVAMDVKAPLDRFRYRRAAGVPVDVSLIWRSIDLLKQSGVDHQFRMTVLPELHREEDIRRVGQQVRAGRRLVLQNFNPKNVLDPWLRDARPYDPEVLKRMERDVQAMV